MKTLARKAIVESEACLPWMEQQGIRFQPSLSGTLSLSRTNAFFLGGGKALVNALYRTAESLGVDVRYEAEVTHLDLVGDKVVEVVFDQGWPRTARQAKGRCCGQWRFSGRYGLVGACLG